MAVLRWQQATGQPAVLEDDGRTFDQLASERVRLRHEAVAPMSLVEALANVAVGFGVAVATQIAVFPLFGLREHRSLTT